MNEKIKSKVKSKNQIYKVYIKMVELKLNEVGNEVL